MTQGPWLLHFLKNDPENLYQFQKPYYNLAKMNLDGYVFEVVTMYFIN